MTETRSHDERIVDQFTRWAKPFADLPLHSEADGMARALAAAAIAPRSRVLDVACGPGIVACTLAERVAHVTGIDLTPAMIAQAKARQQRLSLQNMDWRVGDATRLPFEDQSFDTVVTRYSFHHMPRPSLALAEMRRTCRLGGRVVVIDATPSAEAQACYDQMEILRDPSHASALTQHQLRAMGRKAGLKEVAVEAYRLEAQLSTLADSADMEALNALFDADIASGADRLGVGPWRAADGVRFYFPISIIAWDRPA